MFQEATLFPWLTAGQNVDLALKLRGMPKAERKDRVEELLELVHLGGRQHKRPHELSGGMRQRTQLARVLAQEAEIVLMDEPFAALDAMTRDSMHDEIERIQDELGLTIVFVTHNVREAVRLADRTVLFFSSPGRVKTEYPRRLRASAPLRHARHRRAVRPAHRRPEGGGGPACPLTPPSPSRPSSTRPSWPSSPSAPKSAEVEPQRSFALKAWTFDLAEAARDRHRDRHLAVRLRGGVEAATSSCRRPFTVLGRTLGADHGSRDPTSGSRSA